MLKEISAVVVVIISMIAKLCVPDIVKSLNVKVFNLVLRTNEKRHIKCNELVNVNVD